MTGLPEIQIPLHKTFNDLMKLEAGQPERGVDFSSYLLLIETLQNGYGLNSKAELFFLCSKLWLKPFHRKSQVLNQQILETTLQRNLDLYTNNDVQAAAVPGDNIDLARQEPGETKKDIPEDSPKKRNDIADQSTSVNPLVETMLETGDVNLYIQQDSNDQGEAAKNDNFDNLFLRKTFNFHNAYLPVSRRFIEQTIRSLRFRVPGAGRPVIDIRATVYEVARKGFFEDWQLAEEDGFVSRWTLLLDHGGSMVAFQDMLDALADSATAGSMKNEGDVFYFRNYPVNFLYTNQQHTRNVPLKKVAFGTARNILIVSDAGAARGFYSSDRVLQTYGLLYMLRKHRIAWLNPMPRVRWKDSSAEEIATFVHMFEPGDDNGDTMANIVQLLKSNIVTVNI